MKSFARDFAMEFGLLIFLGLLVALAMVPVLKLDAVRQLDLSFGDLLMRQLVHRDVADPKRNGLRFVFVNVDEESCADWAKEKKASCSASLTIPRDKLAAIANAFSQSAQRGGDKPKLVVFDFELSPLPAPADGADASLCGAIVRLSRHVPVEGIRPLSVGLSATGLDIDNRPSILDRGIEGHGGCAGETSANIWLGSSLVESDSDGAVRSVDAWDMARTDDGHTVAVPSLGLLGAALLDESPNSSSNRVALGCIFLRAGPSPCPSRELRFGDRRYDLAAPPRLPNRIQFLVPYGKSGQRGIENYGYTPSVVESVEAAGFASRLADEPHLLLGAVVVVGDSYAASGDLYRTPLNLQFPGAMIHANAINAYATGRLIEEQHGWGIELVLIACAAFARALSNAAGHRAVDHLSWPLNDVVQMLIALAGVAAAITVVYLIAGIIAFDKLEKGNTLIGVITPACFVALEGFCTILHDIRQFIHPAGRHLMLALKRKPQTPEKH